MEHVVQYFKVATRLICNTFYGGAAKSKFRPKQSAYNCMHTLAYIYLCISVYVYYMLLIYVWNGEFIYIFFILYQPLPVTTTTLESSRRAYKQTKLTHIHTPRRRTHTQTRTQAVLGMTYIRS